MTRSRRKLQTTLGTLIIGQRYRMGWSQDDLAERLGVTRQAVSSWELDRSRPSPASTGPLAEALSLPIEQVIALCTERPRGRS